MRALLLLLLVTSAASAQTGAIEGTVLEADGQTAIVGANVLVEGMTGPYGLLGAATDVDGHYRIVDVPVGTYTVKASYAGYPSLSVEGVAVIDARATPLDLTIRATELYVITIDDSDIGRPLTSTDVFAGRILYGTEIENMPVPR